MLLRIKPPAVIHNTLKQDVVRGHEKLKYYIINSTNALSKIFEISAFNFDVLAVPNSHPNQNHAYSLLVTIQSFKTLRFIYLEQ